MKTEIMYATHCALTVVDRLGGHWELVPGFDTLKDALDCAEGIIDREAMIWNARDIDTVFITDRETGEILAECAPNWVEEPDSDWNDDCDYEMGYDPYLGCFTWDE